MVIGSCSYSSVKSSIMAASDKTCLVCTNLYTEVSLLAHWHLAAILPRIFAKYNFFSRFNYETEVFHSYIEEELLTKNRFLYGLY